MRAMKSLKYGAAALGLSLVFGVAGGAVRYAAQDVTDYQQTYPTFSVQDAESLREERAGEFGIAIFLALGVPGVFGATLAGGLSTEENTPYKGPKIS